MRPFKSSKLGNWFTTIVKEILHIFRYQKLFIISILYDRFPCTSIWIQFSNCSCLLDHYIYISILQGVQNYQLCIAIRMTGNLPPPLPYWNYCNFIFTCIIIYKYFPFLIWLLKSFCCSIKPFLGQPCWMRQLHCSFLFHHHNCKIYICTLK